MKPSTLEQNWLKELNRRGVFNNKNMPFKDLKIGQTHYQNDGCGEPAHNSINMKSLILTCDCVAKKIKPCGKIKVIDYGNGDCEINGIFLDKKSVEKLINYLKKLK